MMDRFARFMPGASALVLLAEHHGEKLVFVWEVAALQEAGDDGLLDLR